MELELYQYIIAIMGGLVAGVINTLAGSGSVITLSILTELLGLPGNLANGTNRVGIGASTGLAACVFYKNGKLPLKRSRWIIISMLVGALFGVFAATQISNEQFTAVFKFLLVVMLFVILVKPTRWLHSADPNYKLPLYFLIPIYLALGFYGGFIQLGMGVFFVATTVLLNKYNIVEANAIKVFIVSLYTLVVLWIFHLNGLVDWKIGAIIASGQMTGAYLTSQYMSTSKGAEVWAYRALVIIVVAVLIRQFLF